MPITSCASAGRLASAGEFVDLLRRRHAIIMGGRPEKVSTPVKTLIDCLDRPDLAGV